MLLIDTSIGILPDGFDESVADLRNWLEEQAQGANAVRNEAYWLALSASLMRFSTFDADKAFEQYSAMDLANIVVVAKKSNSIVIFIRAAFSRAMVDEDQPLVQAIASRNLVPDLVGWWTELHTLNLDQAKQRLHKCKNDEESAAVRLTIGRLFPELLRISWVSDIATEHPVIAHAMARCIALTRPDLGPALATLLGKHQSMLLVRDPDLIFAPLVLSSESAPQDLLKTFSGLYGEQTVLNAARWHLEHDQNREAGQLARSVRIFSDHADHAMFISGLAAVEAQDKIEWKRCMDLVRDMPLQRQLLLRACECDHSTASLDTIASHAKLCQPTEPETFYRFLKLILDQGGLTFARDVCAAVAERFNHHPSITAMIKKVLAG